MSWVVEEWKEGLSTKALQKIQEIETQLDKLKKERQQRQFQLESLEAALLKQKQKVENEKTETSALKREHQNLIESYDNLEKTRQKISHELQVKESQVNYLEGQLASSKKQVDKLEQENKRYKSEFERSQQTAMPADVQSRTPQRNLSGPTTPNQNVDDSKLKELQEKYSKEVEERSRLETELKIIQAKLTNQTQPHSTISHRNIARQRSSSSVFPWQQDQTPSQQASSLETPLKKGSAVNLQWEQEETPFKHCPKSLQKTPHPTGVDSSKQEEQLKLQNQELQTKILDLELRLQAQEKEIKNHMNKLHEIQFQFEKAKIDFSEKEHKLSKCRDELTKVTAQCEQASTKCVMVEQKLKQVSDELNCYRQNADTTRRNIEQKLKDKEKEFQQELSHQQHSLQSLDQQFSQMKNKLNQELQQSKNDYNVLQSEIDKVSAYKQKLERELDEIRQKLCCSDQMLKANQTKENDLKKKLEAIQKERTFLGNQLQQHSTQIHQLEDELKKTKQDFNRTWNFGEEMKNKNTAQEAELKSLRQELDEQSKSMCINTENHKQQISQLKMEHDSALKDMKEKEKNMEQLNVHVGTMENEIKELQKNMQLKEKAFQELKEENSSLAQWKVENMDVVDNFKCEKEGIENKIKELEQSLEVSLNKNQEQEQQLEVYQCESGKQSEKLKLLEEEKENLQRQTDDLKQVLDNKTSELETQKQTVEEFTKKAWQEEQKHGKDVENLSLCISQLTSQIAELEKNLQQETNKVEKLEESRRVFCADYENVSNLAKSKDCLIELKETEILNLKDSISQTTHNLEEQLAKVEAEKNHLMEEYEKSIRDRIEVENAKSTLENYQHDISVFKEQIASQESSLKLEKHLQSEMQSKYDALLKLSKELEEKIEETEKKHMNLQAEMEQEIHKLKMQHVEALQTTIDEKDKSIQNFARELESKVNNLKCLQVTNIELETKLEVCFQSAKCIEEKEELISLKEKELLRLSEENEELKDSINILMQENMELKKMNSSFADVVKKNETMLREQTTKYEEETATKESIVKDLKTLCEELTEKQRLLENTLAAKENDIKQLLEKMNEKEIREDRLVHQYATLEEELKNLQEKCSDLEEKKDLLEMQLCERSKELLLRNAEVEELEKNHAESYAEYDAKVVGYEEKVKAMIEEIRDLQAQLEKMEEIDHLKKELSESKARQNKILEAHNELLQEKEQLTNLLTKQAEKETIFVTKIEKLENDLIINESENTKNVNLIAEINLLSDQLKDSVITKEIEHQRLQAQLQLLQMDLEDKEASLESFISQLEQMQTDHSNVESKFQHSEENRTLLGKELSAMQVEMEAMHLKFSESKNHEESLLGQITLQRQTIEEMKSEFEKQKEDLGRLESQFNERQTKFQQKADEQCQLKENKISELLEKLFRSETQIGDLMSRNSDIESQMDSLQQELKAQMQITLSNMENTLQQSEEQKALVQKDLSKVQSELSAVHLHCIENKNREESLMEQLALQGKTIEDLKSELEKSKEQEAHLIHSLENIKNQLNTSQINSKPKAEEEYRLRNKEILELGESFSWAPLQLNDLIIQCPLESSQQKLKNEHENSMQHKNIETTAEKYTDLLQEFSSCQLAKENLEASLQQADKKYEDLENAYKTVQHEKTVLAAKIDNLIPCIGICGKNSCLAEKTQVLTNEMRPSGVENVFLQTELERLNAANERSNTCPSQNENVESMIISDELQQYIKHHNPSYDDLKHSNEQLKEQVMKIKQKLFSYQHQNGKLHEQHCNTMSKMSELQSIIAALETEKASLLSKVDLTSKIIDPNTQEYKNVKEEMIMSQETRHQNIPEEKEIADCVVEHDTSGERKTLLIEKSNNVVEDLTAELSLLQSNLIEAQVALSGTKIEKVTLQTQLRVLESSLEGAHLHVSEQNKRLQQLEKMIQEKDDEIILLYQQLKENSTNLIVNDQAIFSVRGTHRKMKTMELETCSVTSEQSITLLQEQLQKQQDAADEEIQELNQTLTATRRELETLRQQNSSEIEDWQLKLSSLTTEMENKLAAQKQQTELLFAELEGARIQLQSLDLSSQSLLYASYLSEESSPQKLKHIDSKEQQREMTTVTDKLELVNSLIVSPDSQVQREQKASLQAGTMGETPVFSSECTMHFDNAKNISKDIDDELNESNTKQQCIVEQIHLDNEKVTVPVECQPTHQVPIGSQVQLEQESGQILHLLPDEENKKKTEVLLSEMKILRSRLDAQQKELFFKATAYTELEKKILLFEEEKHQLCNELKSSALENQNLADKAKNLEEELINVDLQLQADKVKLSDVTKVLESLEMDKRDRNEQFLELKNELKRAKSDKANLEKHILEMEVDLDELQIRKHTLEKERESSQMAISVQAEKLTELETENNGVIREISTLTETNDELEQTSKRLKAKVQELEAEKIYSANTIRVLEAEVKKLTSQLQTVAEQMEKVSKEREDMIQEFQSLEKNAMLVTEGREEFQKQLNQLKKENLSVLEQTEAMQNKLNVVELEKSKLLQSLESSLLEKGQVAARLNSTKAEVAEMRNAIEKLKVRIEADQKKSQHMVEKLKVSDRKADFLQDKIEALERELQASEENMEDMVLQAETAKEQVEILEEEKKIITEKLELLTVELNTYSSKKQDLEKQLQQSQEKLVTHCSNLSRSSKATENEKLKMAEAYESSINELQSQISHLNERVKICNEELKKLRENEKNYLNQNSCLECEKVQLSNQLHEAAGLNVELQSANTILSKDLQVVQQQLDEHIEEKEKIQQQIADMEQLKKKDSTDMCNLQIEMENLKKEMKILQMAAAESQQAAQDLSAKHGAMQVTKENSEKQLKNELQAAQLQSSALHSQVNDLTENNRKQQNDLSIANEKILKVQREFDTERNLLSAQVEEFKSQAENLKLQLEISHSEKYKLEKDVGHFQNKLQIIDELKKEVEEHKQRLKCIQEEHQAVLKDLQDQREVQVQSYQEKMAVKDEKLTAQDMEINNLKTAKEEVNVALKDAICKVDELQKSVAKLKRDKDCAQNKLLLWMKSCKQLEHEKESLKKHIQQQEELFTKQQKSQKLVGPDSQIEELSAEMEELKESLEEKTKEADENMEKYWNLIKSTHKLEEENDILKSRVVLLNNNLQQLNFQDANSVAEQVVALKSAVHKKCEKKSPGQSTSQQKRLKSSDVSSIAGLNLDSPLELAVSKSHKKSSDSQSKLTTKRVRGTESKEEQDELKLEALQNSSKRTRSGEVHKILLKSAAQDATSYEPEGLPHIVKKGFADIPSISLSPYVLRRTTLLNRASSDLAAQSRISPHRQTQHKGIAQTCKNSETTAEGSHAQQHPAESTCSSPALILDPIPALSRLSSLTNSPKKMGFNILDGKQVQKSRCSLNTKKFVEQKELHKEQIAVTEETENCKVQ
uniref:centromere protein F isoform X2 n=1 Tax=Pristiophorus japonicus TaxID=55135 RepID=UPI00398F8423